jgi:hypothetical protein
MAILSGLTVGSVTVDPGGRTGTTWVSAPDRPPFATDVAVAAAGLAWELRRWGSWRTSWRDAQDDIFGPSDRAGETSGRPTRRDQVRFAAAVVRVDRILRCPEVATTVLAVAAAIRAQTSGALPGTTVQQITTQHLGGRATGPGPDRIAVAGFSIGIHPDRNPRGLDLQAQRHEGRAR